MAKIPVMIGNEIIADGEPRPSGKLAWLESETATYLLAGGKARAATPDEIAAAPTPTDVLIGPEKVTLASASAALKSAAKT